MTKEECPNCPGRDDHDAEHCPIKPSNADECKRFAGEREAFKRAHPELDLSEKPGEWESARISDFNSGWNACRDAVVTLLQKAAWMELDTTRRSIAIQDELRSILAAAAPAQGQRQQVECQECERLRSLLDASNRVAGAVTEKRDQLRAELAATNQALRESRANDLTTMATLADVRAELAALKAQQVGQEPVAWLDPGTGTKATTDYDAYGKHGIPLYTTPQPAPAQDVAWLVASAKALLDLDEQGALTPHGIGGLARDVITGFIAAHDKQSGGVE